MRKPQEAISMMRVIENNMHKVDLESRQTKKRMLHWLHPIVAQIYQLRLLPTEMNLV